MEIGKSYKIPILNKGNVEMLTATTEKMETVETKLGKKEAFKVLINSTAKGKTIKGGDIIFWFAADETRAFLKFVGEIKIGSISGELVKYSRPNE